MTEEFNLSDKCFTSPILAGNLELNADLAKLGYSPDFIFLNDVKEFIKRLKEEFENKVRYESIENQSFVTEGALLHIIETKEMIDKLAGEKLI